jgi:hypothetical protein
LSASGVAVPPLTVVSLSKVNAGNSIKSLAVVCLSEGSPNPERFVKSLSTITAPLSPLLKLILL